MHLASPVFGDLRMNIMPDRNAGEVQLFNNMEIGDMWADADLKPCFDFLLGCKHTRTLLFQWVGAACGAGSLLSGKTRSKPLLMSGWLGLELRVGVETMSEPRLLSLPEWQV